LAHAKESLIHLGYTNFLHHVYSVSRKKETNIVFYITQTDSHVSLQYLASNIANVLGNYH